MKKTPLFLCAQVLLICMISLSCNSKSDKEPAAGKKDTPLTKKKEPVKADPEPEVKYQRPPIINIVDTVAPKRIIAFSKDTAATLSGMYLKIAMINNSKVAEYIKKNNLKTAGAPTVWYTKTKKYYRFGAGIIINKRGAKGVKGVEILEHNPGKVLVAHFYGPYDLIPQGYEALREWMKENKKRASNSPFEMHVTKPIDKSGKPVDPYKIQTDIVFPIR
ncbi:MAG TPA: GyrI-like domain-containing protein [Ferruginibacter sp.]|nr:GyrI-like domain-containing protein [Ferruginibacter sp.]